MDARASYRALAPGAMQALRSLGEYLDASGLDERLRRLVELRVSQLNHCAFCCDLHAEQARRAGERQQRLDVLAAWPEAPLFSPKERAALAWAEAVARVGEAGVGEALYRASREHLSEQELVDLTLVVGAMGVWNRLAVSFGTPVRART